MFTVKKLILAAACVVLALGSATVAAEPQGAHLRVHTRSNAQTKAVDEAALEAGSKADDGDDDASSGSSGEPGDKDDSDVEVVIKVEPIPDEKPFCSGEGEYTVSVEFAEGIYCVKGPACVADQSDGVCPGPQKGLPNGSRCGKVASGVYGCTLRPPETPAPGAAGSSDSEDTEEPEGPVDSADFCPGDEEYEISVAGASGVFCISGQACVSGIADGTCPGPQKGLPYGSYCGLVQDGVYGCKVNPPPSKHHKKAQSSKTHSKAKKDAHSKSKKKKGAKARSHRSKKVSASKSKEKEGGKKVSTHNHQKKTESRVRTSRHKKEN